MGRVSGWLRHTIGVFIAIGLVLAASPAWAQQQSGVNGVVQDESGSVLPGVTVEVSSPALIEKVRTAITDGEGRYSITALVPGTYSVTFTLPGFRTTRREGIVLTTAFVATVNANMVVGGIEETVTVTGAPPIIDTTSVKGQTLVSQELLADLPSSTLSLQAVQKVTPGLSQSGVGADDVGGSKGAFWGNSMGLTYHGKINSRILYDGLPANDFVSAVNSTQPSRLEASGYFVNLGAVDETAFESSAVGVDSLSSGISFNSVPKAGGNRFSFRGYGVFGKDSLIWDNRDETGLPNAANTTTLFTGYGALGGPIMQDKLWFFTAPKGDYLFDEQMNPYNYNSMQGSPFYVPDPNRPSELYDKVMSVPVRLTWQASAKNTINGSVDVQPYCGCPQFAPANAPWAAEAQYTRHSRGTMTQVSWVRPHSSRVLFEAAGSWFHFRVTVPRARNSVNDIGITDNATSLVYNARLLLGLTGYGKKETDRFAQRASMSYVTGSHNFKVGFANDGGRRVEGNEINQDISYNVRGFAPGSTVTETLTLYSTPYTNRAIQKADLIVYAQDRWTLNRLTINGGLQFQYTNAYAPEQDIPATRWVPFVRHFDKVENLPNYKDLNPRVGAAYDLFGDGRTAIKTSFSRYTYPIGVGLAFALNPVLAAVNQVTRTWIDATGVVGPGGVAGDGDYVPDCDQLNPLANGECGPWRNQNFGKSVATTQWDPRTREGWHKRDGYWEFTAEVAQQLADRASVTVGYSHNWQFNQRVERNTAVNPETDFTPFTLVAPVDSRLPGGGGYQINGFYNVNPDKATAVNTVVMPASDFGNPVAVNDFISVTFQGRFAGSQIGGGVDTGRSVTDTCFVVNSPQDAFFRTGFPAVADTTPCRQVTGFADQTQLRAFATVPLPWGIGLSGIYTNTPGFQILGNFAANNANVIGLGRPLVNAPVRTTLLPDTSTSFDSRKSQLDLQLSRWFDLRSGWRFRPQMAVYNLLNVDSLAGRVQACCGALYGPSVIVPGRTIQFSGEVTF